MSNGGIEMAIVEVEMNTLGEDNSSDLKWKDVKYSVKPRKGEAREILKGISGHAKAGRVLAIMGSSGAGKTTLLNILSKRLISMNQTILSGEISLNNKQYSSKAFKKRAAYVMQEDILMETLTPREIFDFSGKMRLPKSTTEADREAAVEKTLTDLKLTKCADTRVGGVFVRGLSGGERKRVSIGMELITNPTVLFVDEPTSGLDSATAERVFILLKDLANQGKIVITTIHQPSSEIFAQFDDLMLLSAGKVVYFGKADESVSYFSSIGYSCPQFSCPADYFMKIMQSGDKKDNERVQHLISSFEDVEKSSGESFQQPVKSDATFKEDAIPWASGLWSLTSRAFKNFIRQPMLTKVRLAQNIFLGLLSGFLFFQVGDNQTSIQDRQGGLFFIAMNNAMTSIMTTVLSFPPEKAIFSRETANNTYTSAMYYWGKTIAEFPFQFVFPLVNSVIAYFLMGLRNGADHFFIYLSITTLLALTGQSFGLTMGCLTSDANVAVSITPVTIIPLMLFAGFFVNSDSLAIPFRVLQYISPFYYGFNALAINEFKDLPLKCDAGEFISTPGSGSQMTQVCPITNGNQVIDKLNIDQDGLAFNIILLLTLGVVTRILGYIVLRLKSKI